MSNLLEMPNLLSTRRKSNPEDTIEELPVRECALPTSSYHRRRHSDNLILTNRSKEHLNNIYNNSLNKTNKRLFDARLCKDKEVPPCNLNNNQGRRHQRNLTSNTISETTEPLTQSVVTTNRRQRNRRQSDGCLVLPSLQPPGKLIGGRRALTPMPLTRFQSMKGLNEIECEISTTRKCNSICDGGRVLKFDALKTKEIGTSEKIEKFLRSLSSVNDWEINRRGIWKTYLHIYFVSSITLLVFGEYSAIKFDLFCFFVFFCIHSLHRESFP